jgi:hypothetical protein
MHYVVAVSGVALVLVGVWKGLSAMTRAMNSGTPGSFRSLGMHMVSAYGRFGIAAGPWFVAGLVLAYISGFVK